MDTLDQKILNDFQRDFPLTPQPYADLADQLGVSEQDVIDHLKQLKADGAVSRVGAVFRPGTVGASTLAAMAVPESRLVGVAEIVNSYGEVNHNYEREHRLNLWFVITAADKDGVAHVITDIERRTGLEVLDLPMLEDFHLDLGFDLR